MTALLLLSARGAAAARVSGTLALREADGSAADASEAFVWFTPAGGAAVTPHAVEITTKDKTFAPRACTVARGSTVHFPNADPILHNVFSVSGGNRFDLGLYRTGPGKAVTLKQPGIVRVFCNVHQTMAAFIAVLDTPHVAAVDARGRFTLDGVPDGPGTVTAWHWRAGAPSTREIAAPATNVALTLDAHLTGVPSHLTKTGKPYAKAAGDGGYR